VLAADAIISGSIYFTTNVDTTASLVCYEHGTTAGASAVISKVIHSLAIHPLSKFLYVVKENSPPYAGVVSIDTFDPGLAMPPSPLNPFPQTPQNIAFNASGVAFVTARTPGQPGRLYQWTDGAPAPPVVWSTGSTTPSTGVRATDAEFNGPYGVAIDAAGNMLISEYDGCRVWLVEAQSGQQLLRLVAGTAGAKGVCGSSLVASDPTQTWVNNPAGVSFGLEGKSAFIADKSNHRILKVMLECVGA
jgi:hypothetical protein